MPPKQDWTQLAEFRIENDFIKYRWSNFCCSAIFAVRTRTCIVCPGDHEMIERRLHCRSPTCEEAARPSKCIVTWKVHHCAYSSTWRVFSSGRIHARGYNTCAVPPSPIVTPEMRAYIQRMDDSAVPPRLIWSNMIRAPDIPAPVLGFPSCAQVQRRVRYNRWLQGSKNCIELTRKLVCSKAFSSDLDPESAFVFGNREDSDGFPFVGNGEDEEPLILGITSIKLMKSLLHLQQQEVFLIFHLDATFKLSDIGYPVITCGFTDRRRIYHLASLFIVSQRTQREYYEAIGTFLGMFRERMGTGLRIDAVMGDAETAQLNALKCLADFEKSIYLMCFFHVLYNVRKRIRHLPEVVRAAVYRGVLDMHYTLSHEQFIEEWNRVSNEWLMDGRLGSFSNYFYTQWISSPFWRWQIYHSPGGYATTNNPCEVFNASIKRYTQRKVHDTRRLILKLLTIAEDYSICSAPSVSGSVVAPPQEAKRLAKVLVSSGRVVVFSTPEHSVVRVLYLGDQRSDTAAALDISNLPETQDANVSPFLMVLSPECLTDEEKAKATMFYRTAVKWSDPKKRAPAGVSTVSAESPAVSAEPAGVIIEDGEHDVGQATVLASGQASSQDAHHNTQPAPGELQSGVHQGPTSFDGVQDGDIATDEVVTEEVTSHEVTTYEIAADKVAADEVSTDEPPRVRAELSLRSLNVYLQKQPTYEAEGAFKSFKVFQFPSPPKIKARILKKLPAGALVKSDQITKILPLSVIRSCNAKVFALQKRKKQLAEREIALEVGGVGFLATSTISTMTQWYKAVEKFDLVTAALNWIGHIDFAVSIAPEFRVARDHHFETKLKVLPLFSSQIHCLDLAGKSTLGDMTLNTVLMKLFGGRSGVICVEPASHAVLMNGGTCVDTELLRSRFVNVVDEILLLPVNCGGVHWCSVMVNVAAADVRIYDPMQSSFVKDVRSVAMAILPLLPPPAKPATRYHVRVFDTVELRAQTDSYNCGVFVLVAFEMFLGSSPPGKFSQGLLQYLRYRYLLMCL